MRSPLKVLVTGGSGFLGKAIVKLLLERGDKVRSFARTLYPQLASIGVDVLCGDIADKDAVESACRGVDLVFHVAAKPPPWGNYKDYFNTNVKGTQNVIDACMLHNVAGLIYTSTPSVVFDGTDMEGVDESIPYPERYNAFYPKTKAMAEQRVANASGKQLRTVVLRPHQIWGPDDPHFVPGLIARAKGLKQIGNGKNLVDTTYIDNAADAHILAADKLQANPAISGNIYFISQGEPIPAWDMINAILEAVGMEPVRGSVSYPMAWSIGAVLEFIYRTLHIQKEPRLTRFLVTAAAKSHWFDISAAKRDLGYEPRISTAEGLLRLQKWFEARDPDGALQ